MKLSRSELLDRLNRSFEWNDLEVKAARTDVPRDAYETVSAFANTAGGLLVFGVKQVADGFDVQGVENIDKVQNDFLSALRSKDTISYQVSVTENAIDIDGRNLLLFHINEAPRQQKPVHLGKDASKCYIRKGAGDQKCTQDEMSRFLRDRNSESYDSCLVDVELDRCFDAAALGRYRRRFADRDAGHVCNGLDDRGFLEHWALVQHKGGRLLPTRAAILLFGAGPALRALLPRPVVDVRWASYPWDSPAPAQRWLDRMLAEDNLWITWEKLLERYTANAARPFEIDMVTMERRENPENFISFKEAAINVLTHQDYAEIGRSAVIAFHPDRLVFENAGPSWAPESTLLERGQKPVRNPLIVGAFRRVGLGDQAGTGIAAIFGDWTSRGRVPPECVNDVVNHTFRLSLLAKQLLSEKQLLFQASLGAKLSKHEAQALALVCDRGQTTVAELRASLGLGSGDVTAVLGRLQQQILVSPVVKSGIEFYVLAEHLRDRWTPPAAPVQNNPPLVTDQAGQPDANMVSDQAGPNSGVLVTDQASHTSSNLVTDQGARRERPRLETLTDQQRRILLACGTPQAMKGLMELFGVTHSNYFRQRHLLPLLEAGLVETVYPAPKHPNQRYKVTEIGAMIASRLSDAGLEAGFGVGLGDGGYGQAAIDGSGYGHGGLNKEIDE